MDKSERRFIGRLAAELSVIVLGVLIALGVDGLANRRAEATRATEALRMLQTDLTASRDELRASNASTMERVETLRWFRDLHFAGGPLPTDSVQSVERAAYITSAYSPILRTHDALIATGSLGLIENPDIQFGLADIRRLADEYLDYRGQTTNGWIFSLMPIWLEWIGDDSSAQDYEAALSDRRFRAMVRQRGLFLRFTAGYGTDLANRMDEVLELVNTELSRRE